MIQFNKGQYNRVTFAWRRKYEKKIFSCINMRNNDSTKYGSNGLRNELTWSCRLHSILDGVKKGTIEKTYKGVAEKAM